MVCDEHVFRSLLHAGAASCVPSPAYGPLNKGSDSSRQPPPQESFRVRLGPGEGKEDEEIRTLANIMWNFLAAADRSLSPEWFLDSSPFIHPTGHRHRLPTEAELMCDRLIEIWDSDQVSRCPACLFSSFVTSKQEEEQHREWLSDWDACVSSSK